AARAAYPPHREKEGRSVPRALAALRQSISYAPAALPAFALAAAPVRGQAEDKSPEAEPLDVVVTAPPGSTRAPAAQSTVVEADKFAGEVRSVAELLSTSPGGAVQARGGPGTPATLCPQG